MSRVSSFGLAVATGLLALAPAGLAAHLPLGGRKLPNGKFASGQGGLGLGRAASLLVVRLEV